MSRDEISPHTHNIPESQVNTAKRILREILIGGPKSSATLLDLVLRQTLLTESVVRVAIADLVQDKIIGYEIGGLHLVESSS